MAASSKQEAERLARIHEALELASGGAFAEAVDAISVEAEDALGGIERGLRGLVADFRIAVAQSDEAISELTSAKTELQQRLATIEQQQAAIRELSSPIIDVWDGVITIPLVGLIDSERIADLHGRLLTHIGGYAHRVGPDGLDRNRSGRHVHRGFAHEARAIGAAHGGRVHPHGDRASRRADTRDAGRLARGAPDHGDAQAGPPVLHLPAALISSHGGIRLAQRDKVEVG